MKSLKSAFAWPWMSTSKQNSLQHWGHSKQRSLPRLTGIKVGYNHQEASNEKEAKQWRGQELKMNISMP